MKNLKSYKPKNGFVLVLKSVKPDMTAGYNGIFLWPEKGRCSAPDWKPINECGYGLHGWKWGEGDADLRVKEEGAKWLVLSVLETAIIDLSGKVKFPECEVLFVGEMADAVLIIQEHAPIGNKCIFGTATAGESGTATAGDGGTATAGESGTATAGDGGTATAGDSGTATAGDSGTATAGDRGTATAGDRGTATAGYRGTATAGSEGVITIKYYDRKTETYKRKTAMVDGITILPGVKYRIDDSYEFEPVNETVA